MLLVAFGMGVLALSNWLVVDSLLPTTLQASLKTSAQFMGCFSMLLIVMVILLIIENNFTDDAQQRRRRKHQKVGEYYIDQVCSKIETDE